MDIIILWFLLFSKSAWRIMKVKFCLLLSVLAFILVLSFSRSSSETVGVQKIHRVDKDVKDRHHHKTKKGDEPKKHHKEDDKNDKNDKNKNNMKRGRHNFQNDHKVPCKLKLLDDYPGKPYNPVPCQRGVCNKTHHYLFLIVPPYHGSTALEYLTASSPAVSTMCDTTRGSTNYCEGTWKLIRSRMIASSKRRWDENQPKNWVRVIRFYERFWNTTKCILVDKSPPNLVKAPRIARQLQKAGKSAAFIFMTRSPCFMGEQEHRLMRTNLDRDKIQMATHKELVESGVPVIHIRYEDFYQSIDAVMTRLLKWMPCLESMNPYHKMKHLEKALQKGKTKRGRSLPLAEYINQSSLPTPHTAVDTDYKEFLEYFGYR